MKEQNNIYYRVLNTHGSAIIMALVTMTVLVLLGLAVATLSMGTLVSNTADQSTNDSYYAAEAGVNSAIEHLKYEASKYYATMMVAQGATYNDLYNNFFTTINNNAQLNFIDPAITGVTIDTTFTTEDIDTTQDIGEFLISCKATANGTSYAVNGKLYIKRVDVSHSQYIWITDDAAIKAGGTLDLESKNSVTVYGGNLIVANLLYTTKDENVLPYSITDGQLLIVPTIGSTILDLLVYPSYTDPVLTTTSMYITDSSYSINWDVPAPVSITTVPGSDLHFTACTISEGIVYGKGDLHITNCIINSDIYCDGDIIIDNYSSINGNIYCRGNITITNADIGGNIYCDGIVDFNNGSLDASVYAGGPIVVHAGTSSGNLFSPSEITIENANVTNGIVYSSSKLTIGSGVMTSIFFSGDDIEFTSDVSVNGTVIAKNDISFKVDANKDLFVNYYYSETTVDNIVNDPKNRFFFSIPNVAQLDENVFTDQSVTAVGRIN